MQQMKKEVLKEQHNNVIPFIPEGDFYFTKGVEAFQKKKFDIAIKWILKAIEDVPGDPLYQCQLSIIYTEIGAYKKANLLLTEVLQTMEDKYTDCYYLLANNYAHLGLLKDAKKYALIYLEEEPEGNFSEEAASLLEVIDIDEDEEDNEWNLEYEDELLIYQETVFHHMENMEWDKALPLLEEMMALFPEYISTKHDYTLALFFTGDQDKAIQMELEELSEHPTSLYCHANLAIFYFELEKKEAYEQHIQALLNVYPIHEQQKLRVAISLARTGNYQIAYDRFRMLTKGLVKSHPSYFRWFSLTADQVGETSKARILWKEGCKRHPKMVDEITPFP